jgi:choline-sulfatase
MSGEIFYAGAGALVIHAATQWLAANHGAQPVFAFVHLFDMHLPYKFGCDAQLAYVDQLMATFKQALVRGGWWDRSLVILLSDHGESLGDHGYFIYESTLLDRTPRPVAAESTHAFDAFGWSPLRSIRMGEHKYIEVLKPDLYNLAADPHEQTNLALRDPDRAQSMRTALAQLLAAHQPKRPAPLAPFPRSSARCSARSATSPPARNQPRQPSPTPRTASPNSSNTRTRSSRYIEDTPPKAPSSCARSSQPIRTTRSHAATSAASTSSRSSTPAPAPSWKESPPSPPAANRLTGTPHRPPSPQSPSH